MITGVALKCAGRLFFASSPFRHKDVFEMITKAGIDFMDHKMTANDQGFITDKGKYLNRRQAYLHAVRCKQPLYDDAHYGLASENVWPITRKTGKGEG